MESQTDSSAQVVNPATSPRWYAVYTFPRHEKTVAHHLNVKAIECYLPVYERLSRWKDRICRLEDPLFPGYVFIHIPISDRIRVLQVPGVVRILSFNRYPAPLPDNEIESVRTCLFHRRAEPSPYLSVGKRVRIHAGPLEGIEGVILRRKGKMRLVVSIDSIRRSIALELEAADVRLAA